MGKPVMAGAPPPVRARSGALTLTITHTIFLHSPFATPTGSRRPLRTSSPTMQARIDSPEYWLEAFQPRDSDLEMLYEHLIESGQPEELESLARRVIAARVQREIDGRRARASARGRVYQPSDRYEAGQKLLFTALDGQEGKVLGVRPGNNPSYGRYEVIRVALGDAEREFAAGIEWEHPLSLTEVDLDPEALSRRYAAAVAPLLGARLADERDWVSHGDRWILRALLPELNQGHRNLAEAIIMLAGEPLPASQILADLDLDAKLPMATRAMALELALERDERFRNVGALEEPLWTLRQQL